MNVLFIGAKCHARILRRILLAEPHFGPLYRFPLVYDRDSTTVPPWEGCDLLHEGRNVFAEADKRRCTHFVVAVGSNGKRRAEFSEELVKAGLLPISVVHQTAYIGEETTIGRGAQILANTNIGDEVTIGDWCMMHSTSSVEHQSVLEDGVTVMAGASLMGEVTVKKHATIGGHATVMRCTIGEAAMVGAGALVVKDVPAGVTVVSPAAVPLASARKRARFFVDTQSSA